MKISVASMLLLLIASPAICAPFGVDFASDTPEKLGCAPQELAGRWDCDSMPDQGWGLGAYELLYRQDLDGVCLIAGVGPDVEMDPSGEQIRAAVDAMQDQVAAVYGPPRMKNDSALGRDDLTGGAEWADELSEQQREYGYVWTFQPPRDGMEGLYVTAQADQSGEARVHVQAQAPGSMRCLLGN